MSRRCASPGPRVRIESGLPWLDALIADEHGKAAAQAGICYGRMGVSTQAYGALSQWLIQLINIVTGNLDKIGGSLFTLPAIDQVNAISPGGFGRLGC